MTDYLFYLFSGTGASAIIAGLAVGLVLTYQGSMTVSFFHGATATWAAFTFAELRRGDFPLPVPGLPPRISLGDEIPSIVAFPVALLVAGLLAWGLDAAIFRRLRHAPELTRLVAGVGVLVAALSVLDRRMADVRTLRTPSILPREPVTIIDDVTVPRDGIWLVLVVVLMAGALWWASRSTLTGLRIRAVAENDKAAQLMGLSPRRLGSLGVVAGSVATAVVVVLATPMIPMNPTTISLGYLVPALGAAVVARMRSIPVATLAALAIGSAQSCYTQLQFDWSWLPASGGREALPLLVVIVAVAAGGVRLPDRRSALVAPLPPVPPARPTLAATTIVVGTAVLGLTALGPLWRTAMLTSVIAVMFALSFVVLTGMGGQASLAQLAFAGVAGFSLSKFATDAGIAFPLAPLLAATVAGLLGMIVALPALRIRGTELAVITFVAGIAITELVFKNPDLVGDASTGGAPVPNPRLGPWDLGLVYGTSSSRPVFGLFALGVVTLAAFMVINLRRNSTGRRLLALRSSERAAAACGVDVARHKIVLYGISAFLAGLGGCLLAYRFGNLSEASFGPFASLTALTVAYIGGIATVSGAITAGALAASGVVFFAISQVSSSSGRWDVFVGGVLVVVVVVRAPDGLARRMARIGRERSRGLRARRPRVAPRIDAEVTRVPR